MEHDFIPNSTNHIITGVLTMWLLSSFVVFHRLVKSPLAELVLDDFQTFFLSSLFSGSNFSLILPRLMPVFV